VALTASFSNHILWYYRDKSFNPFIATHDKCRLKHWYYYMSCAYSFVCLFLAQRPPWGPGPPHSRGF